MMIMVLMCIVSAADISPCNFKGNELFSYEVNGFFGCVWYGFMHDLLTF